jgi:carbonic anhydrase
MNRRHALKALASLALCPVCTVPGFAADWGYEGAHGPDHWGDVDAASKVCSTGFQQSPLAIESSAAIKSSLPPLQIAWSKIPETILNNGHTIQVNLPAGSTLTVGKDTYNLLQFHFHRPSEHLIDGKSFPMEVHFVHRKADGALGVIGVMMTGGKPNPTFSKIVATMPQKEGPAVKADAAINPNALLPPGRTYFKYEGSLTVPPCNETVDWMLLSQPIQVADADIAAFGKLYAMNARPAQKPFRRYVLKS